MGLMNRAKQASVIWLLGLGFIGCNLNLAQSSDTAPLTSKNSNSTPAQPSCSSCHPYALNDVNHFWHLSAMADSLNQTHVRLNGTITCMDCHFNSIQHFHYIRIDTIWIDSNGKYTYQQTYPNEPIVQIDTFDSYRPVPSGTTDTTSSFGVKRTNPTNLPDSLRTLGQVDTTRGLLLGQEVDTLIARYAAVGQLVSWRTGRAHNNGQVDVSFPPNNLVNPAAASTDYNPTEYSCSEVACHTYTHGKYRWPLPARGITACPSLSDDTTCFQDVP
jgi:hypothetical protein